MPVCVRAFGNTHVGQSCTADFCSLAVQSQGSACHVSLSLGMCVLSQTYIDTFVVRQKFFGSSHLFFASLPTFLINAHYFLFLHFRCSFLRSPRHFVFVWLVRNNSLTLVAFSLFISIYWLCSACCAISAAVGFFRNDFCTNLLRKVGRLGKYI